MQEKYIKINNLQVSEKLSNFVNDELLKNTNVSSENFWLGLEKTLDDLAPKNKQLIKLREDLQKKIDDWHIKNKGKEFNLDEYKKFLLEIGYLKNEGPDFKIETKNFCGLYRALTNIIKVPAPSNFFSLNFTSFLFEGKKICQYLAWMRFIA